MLAITNELLVTLGCEEQGSYHQSLKSILLLRFNTPPKGHTLNIYIGETHIPGRYALLDDLAEPTSTTKYTDDPKELLAFIASVIYRKGHADRLRIIQNALVL